MGGERRAGGRGAEGRPRTKRRGGRPGGDVHGWDGRTLEDTGLAPRIVAALRKAGVESCGDWGGKEEVLAGTGLPTEDCEWAGRVGRVLAGALGGQGSEMEFADWLGAMLPERWRRAVEVRMALDGEGTALSLHDAPLGMVGEALGVTRERARQVLGMAGKVLAAPLAQWAAGRLYGAARAVLESAGGGMFPAEWAAAAGEEGMWRGVSPVGALLVLHGAAPERIGLHRGLFVSLSVAEAEALDGRLRAAMRQGGGLVPLGVVGGSAKGAAMMERLARTMPDALVSRDGRAGLVERDARRLLREILLARGALRLETLAGAFNASVFPECQRGVGKVREWVLGDAAVRRVDAGVYGLAEGYQPELFAGG